MITSSDGRWSPGIGDPTVMGWVTVAAYFVALILCAMCAAGEVPTGRHRRFWLLLAIVMALLGMNKQLDLQTWFTQTGRDLALAQGWYAIRGVVQAVFIAALAIGGLAVQILLFNLLRDMGAEVRGAALGLVFLAVFVIIRAASFHHVDVMLGVELEGVRINWILELGGIACIATAAMTRLRK